ncbi:hypothetical protein GO496_04290 [Acidovorax citrulli]|nr:hypothetical protein [Paracidovorax citrulli]
MDDARDRRMVRTADEAEQRGGESPGEAQQLMDEGYAPLSRFGRYTVDVVDAAGVANISACSRPRPIPTG